MKRESNPFQHLQRQFERIQRQFEEAMDLWDTDEYAFRPTLSGEATIGIDLADNGDEFVLTADVPGYDKDDIDVRFVEDTLHIRASSERDHVEEEPGVYLKNERTRRTLSRSIRIPSAVEEDEISATYRNGVLTLTLPKKGGIEETGHSIEIK